MLFRSQIPVMLGLAILVALLLDQSRGVIVRVCRTVYFMPYGIPTAIGALIWGYMYAPNLSPFNQILRALHQPTLDFLSPDLGDRQGPEMIPGHGVFFVRLGSEGK